MPPPAGALVIGGDYRGLGVVRSLGRRGAPVWVLTDEHRVAAASRFCRRHLPWPAHDEAAQIALLLRLADEEGLTGWALYPTGDHTAALLGRHHALLASRYHVTTPPWAELQRAQDKRQLYTLAEQIGVPAPRTAYPADRAAVEALNWPFPLLLKPAYREEANRFVDDKAWPVHNRAELLDRYDEARALVPAGAIMAQELIPGDGDAQLSYAALCEDGQPLASVVARRTRQYPADFGRASTFVESVTDEEVEGSARRLLAALRFTGIIEVEFKRDPPDGRAKVLDANARVWGWHTLGRRAGVDFPWLQWRRLQGETFPELRGRAGVRWLRLSTDLPAALLDLRHGRLALGRYLASLRPPTEYAIFAADDPWPGCVDLPLLLSLLWRRRGGEAGQ